MQWVGENAPVATVNPVPMWTEGSGTADAAVQAARFVDFKIIRRNGAVVGFEPGKISIAMTKAFLAITGGQGAASARVREMVDQLTGMVINALTRGKAGGHGEAPE